MTTAMPVSGALPAQRSEGVWRTAWRRFQGDRVAMTSLVVVLAFILLIVAAATGVVASQWQRELAVPNAPPTFLGPRAGENTGTLAGPESTARPPVDLSDIDPLAPRYAEWAERAAKLQTAETTKVDTLPLGADRLGRDVLAKAIKGTEISVFVGVLAALLATVIGTVLGALAGFFGGKVGDFLEWLYNVFTAVPDILLIFAFAAVLGRGVDTVVLILALRHQREDDYHWCGPSSSSTAGANTCARPRPSARPPPAACSATSCPTSAM